MATTSHSALLFENVNQLLTTVTRALSCHDANRLYAAIGVKSQGTITFSDNKSNRADFIRVPPDASVTRVKEVLYRKWSNGRPSLVISIIGQATEYDIEPKLLRALRRGLLEVARTTGAWIITGGMNTGIMKLVGEIIQINPDRSRPIHLIGIATWGCVSDHQQLDVHGSNVSYAPQHSVTRGEAALEPNHTGFIFIDDGSEKKYGREIAFRSRLEQAISGGFFTSKNTANSNNQYPSLLGASSLRPEHSDPVPIVLLVVGGGPNTVRTVHEAVVQNNIPAVFLEGTGRCCDLFAKAFRLYKEHRQQMEINDASLRDFEPNIFLERTEEFKNILRKELKDELCAISPYISNADKTLHNNVGHTTDHNARVADTPDYFELVYECMDTRPNFLNVISVNPRDSIEPDIDLAILQALLNATSDNDSNNTQKKRELLHLALEWNRVDIAANVIMRNDRDWEIINLLDDLFLLALNRNQIEFVKLFLDHHFSLTDLFRNTDKLLSLYRNDMTDGGILKNPNDPLLTIYREIIQPLIGDVFDVDAALSSRDNPSIPELIDEDEDQSCFCCAPQHYRSRSNGNSTIQLERSTNYSGGYMDVDKELFLWSVITGRRDFALLFWSRCKNKICAALIATIIYKKRAKKDNDNSYNHSADEFENFAVQIIDKFYQASPLACTKATIRQIPAYGNATWLELAVGAEAKQFIGQRAVQDQIKHIWLGSIDPSTGYKTVIFSTIMLWYGGFVINDDRLLETDKYLNAKLRLRLNQTSQQRPVIDRRTYKVDSKLIPEADNTLVDFVAVGCWEKTRSRIRQHFANISKFIGSPYIKYLYNLYFHLIFLLLFSYLILCEFFPLYEFPIDICVPAGDSKHNKDNIAGENDNQLDINNTLTGNGYGTSKLGSYGIQRHKQPSTIEFVLLIWVFTLFCEEIRQLLSTEAQLKRNAVTAYFKEFWNKLDVLATILFFVGFALRFLPSAECFCAARIILSIDLAIWYIRSLSMFAAMKRLGPQLVMISEMVQDLKFFVLLLIVFMLAYGVSSYSLIHGVQKFSWHLPRIIVNHVFWQIFGEFSTLETFANNYKANGYVAFFLLVAYMAVVSILLINLLIAMFSNTFNRVQTDADRIWKYQRYLLVSEYFSRPALPPPLILFSHLWRLFSYILRRCVKSECIQHICKPHLRLTKYKIQLGEESVTHIEIAEDALGNEIYCNYLKQLVQSPLPQENVLNKIERLENHVQLISGQLTRILKHQESLMNALRQHGSDPEKPYEYRPCSSSSLDEKQSTIINFFRSRRNVTKWNLLN